jgi:ketosteroid isomerase-like protein
LAFTFSAGERVDDQAERQRQLVMDWVCLDRERSELAAEIRLPATHRNIAGVRALAMRMANHSAEPAASERPCTLSRAARSDWRLNLSAATHKPRAATSPHVRCFFEGDLEGVVSDYSADAVLFTPNGPLKGHGPIREFFRALIKEFEQPGTTFSMQLQSIDGDFAYALWSAETADNVYEMATDTHVVRDGKIVAQSFAGQIKPKAITLDAPTSAR